MPIDSHKLPVLLNLLLNSLSNLFMLSIIMLWTGHSIPSDFKFSSQLVRNYTFSWTCSQIRNPIHTILSVRTRIRYTSWVYCRLFGTSIGNILFPSFGRGGIYVKILLNINLLICMFCPPSDREK